MRNPWQYKRPLCAHPGRSADFCHCSEADVRREVMNGEVWWIADLAREWD